MGSTVSFEQNKELGKRLAEIRRSKGISQLSAAKALGTTQSNISQLECGKRRISSSAAMTLCRFYGVSAAEVFGFPEEESVSLAADSAGSLLTALAESSGSEDITSSAEAYISLCVYRMLRALYGINPHNSSELFSLSESEAEKLCKEFTDNEPERLRATLSAGTAQQRSRIELPIERSAELRSFIKTCEKLLGGSRK